VGVTATPPLAQRAARSSGVGRLVAALFVAGGLAAGPTNAATERARVGSGDFAALVDDRQLMLEAQPLPGEGLTAFCRRFTGTTATCPQIAALNGGPRRLLAGKRYRVPYERLAADRQLAVVMALYPRDRVEGDSWLHLSRGESLREVAVWLTGSATRAAELRAFNGRKNDLVRSGELVRVPAALLAAPFRPPPRPAIAAPPTPTPARPPSVAPGAASAGAASAAREAEPARLEYGEDGVGKFALYRLRGGEALYSAVVVRFTGRDNAEDVNALAIEIAKRSQIADVTKLPVGQPVKIAFDLLLPEYLPEGDPRRLEWEVERKLAEQFRNPVKASGLVGVTVILDAGHGGADVGASRAGVWESLYVYDVVERIQRALTSRTRARVLTTTSNGRSGPIEADVLPYSRGHAVLTTPPYPITDATIGVHLRWYLANSVYRQHAQTNDGDRVVFLSVHADSLHPSLRGATAYIPSASSMEGTFGKSGSAFSTRREWRERPTVSFSLRERQKSEGRSRDLAERVIAQFRQHGLEVHPFQPVRDRIFRGRRAWVPAVLRHNAVPGKILLEICNLANDADRALLQTAAFRERIASAVVDGILAYFGENA
jgi:N-acetylmuramoyl-L-alanine amidase